MGHLTDRAREAVASLSGLLSPRSDGALRSNPGPGNPSLLRQFPSSYDPPGSDQGHVPNLWFPFAQAHRRIQAGGWSREVTVKDFAAATDIAGVNMRLTAGGIRELHWHLAAEWAFMLTGTAQITAVDEKGRRFVDNVGPGDLWYFPAGIPHSIQGLQPDGCEFLLAFDDGGFSEFETFTISDWAARTPRGVLAKNFGVDEAAFARIPHEQLYIFQGEIAAEPPTEIGAPGVVPQSFSFRLGSKAPDFQTPGGTVRIADAGNFPVSSTIAAALVEVEPGGLRELHWHPNADEWQYWIRGEARMTVFAASGRSRTFDFHPGDVGYVPRAMGHYIENTGSATLRYLELFRSRAYADISLASWAAQTPHALVAQHLNIPKEVLLGLPKTKQPVLPG
jgi:oxalate decarboxylase